MVQMRVRVLFVFNPATLGTRDERSGLRFFFLAHRTSDVPAGITHTGIAHRTYLQAFASHTCALYVLWSIQPSPDPAIMSESRLTEPFGLSSFDVFGPDNLLLITDSIPQSLLEKTLAREYKAQKRKL